MTIKEQIYANGRPTAQAINSVIAALIPGNALYVAHGSGANKVHEARETQPGYVEVRTIEGWRNLGESALWDAEDQ